MCYLIAKERNAHGCIALKTTHGKHLAEFKYALDDAVSGKGIQLVTISRPLPMVSMHRTALFIAKKNSQQW